MSITTSTPTRAGEFAALEMIRTASSEGARVAHPRPDLQTSQGAYVGNVERLEERAERMSLGSDIGDEIRKLQLDQRLSESRRNSMGMGMAADDFCASPRERVASHSSHHNSIVHVNHAARWGGYSPSGFVGSPVGSVHSAYSWSQSSVQRQRSASKGTKLASVTEPVPPLPFQPADLDSNPEAEQFPLDSLGPPSRASLSEEMKAIAQDIQDQLDGLSPLPPPDEDVGVGTEMQQSQRNSAALSDSALDLPDRPATSASTNTYQQAQTLFMDFDGIHCAPSIRDSIRARSDTIDNDGGARRSTYSGIVPPPQAETWAQPPPEEGMIYYPAPVPRMLNLPQKLSNKPAAAVTAKRRDKLLSRLDLQDKQAAPWLDEDGEGSRAGGKTRSIATKQALDASALPPQLRASLFFDAQPLHQEVQVKGDSAVVTLDSVLEASASLPADAFTDHPFAGHQGARIYGREGAQAARRSKTASMLINPDSNEAARKSTITLDGPDVALKGHKKRRSSFGLIFGRRTHSSNEPTEAEKLREAQVSRLTMRSKSGLPSENAATNDGAVPAVERDAASDVEDAPLQGGTTYGILKDDSDDGEGHYAESHITPSGDPEGEEDEEEDFGPPTTLLAELQKRKAQQKSRTRTAATAFPGGMHSTLLEMDAVAEIEQKRRVKARVPLAWEDPEVKAQMEAENDDDEVPLGLLFTKQNGVVRRFNKEEAAEAAATGEGDWDRPLGLIEQRQLEDNEPLSKRRNRLKGIAPQVMTKRNTGLGALGASRLSLPMASQTNLSAHSRVNSAEPNSPNPDADSKDTEEDEGETLAQRVRRMKMNGAADEPARPDSRPLSSHFATTLLGDLGLEDPDKKNEGLAPPTPEQPAAASTTPDPEETLGQRRARLQTQAARSGSRQTSASSAQLLNGRSVSGAWETPQLLNGRSPSGAWDPSQPQQQQPRAPSALGMNVKRTGNMADLLAAHPLTAQHNTARKVSDEALTSQMPAGSLLAQNEVLQRRNRKRLSDANALGGGGGGGGGVGVGAADGPLIDVKSRKEGEFDRGMLGLRMREKEAQMEAVRQGSYGSVPGLRTPSAMGMNVDPMAMQMNGLAMNGNAMAGMGAMMPGLPMPMMPQMSNGGAMPMMNGAGMMAQGMSASPLMQQQQQQHQHQQMMQLQLQLQLQQQQMAAMGMGYGMGYGFNAAAGPAGPAPPPNPLPPRPNSTYAAFAQNQMGLPPGQDLASLRPEQRDLIDRWRQSVMP